MSSKSGIDQSVIPWFCFVYLTQLSISASYLSLEISLVDTLAQKAHFPRMQELNSALGQQARLCHAF